MDVMAQDYNDTYNQEDYIIQETTQTDSYQTEEDCEVWSNDWATLTILSKDSGSIQFDLSKTSSAGMHQMAYIGSVYGEIDGDTAYFSFDEDGWGHSGTITMSDSSVHVQTVLNNPGGDWSIELDTDLYK